MYVYIYCTCSGLYMLSHIICMYVYLRQNTKMQLSKKACWEEEGLDGLGSFEHEGGLRAKHLP